MPGYSFHADLIDFLELVAGIATVPEMPSMSVNALLTALHSVVIANERSPWLEKASGIAIWFPDNYLALKRLAASYLTLGFCRESGWPQFLNRYFGADDVKPDQPNITQVRSGRRGDARLWWNTCSDLAPVRYRLYEATAPGEAFNDDASGLSNWISVGWTVDSQQVLSDPAAFFSGSGPNLANSIESADPLKLPGGGLLSFHAWYKTKEDLDSDSGGISRNVCYLDWSLDRSMWHALDSLYGDNRSWHERRYVLSPAENLYLRFRYVTGSSANDPGVFVDDIKVYSFAAMRTAADDIPDTTAAVFGIPRDTAGYHYFVTATDSFGNVSMASQFCRVAAENWAEPYTRPAPFAGECELVLDFPAGENPEVLVYTLSGALVRRFPAVTTRVVAWDGCNEHGRPLADGLYLVVVRSISFRKVGKIAKVARAGGQ